MKAAKTIAFLALALGFSSCSSPKEAEDSTSTKSSVMKDIIIEVTSFKTKSEGVDAAAFQQRDAGIEKDYTSKQPGFIKRISGINATGEYAVVVYWESMDAAEASMKKFMSDSSVADYAGMIDGPSMKMARYKLFGDHQMIGVNKGGIIEVTSFQAKSGIGSAAFQKRDGEVETAYTSKQPGFIQRLGAVDEKGEYLVLVYWKAMADADASMKKFMGDKSVTDYVEMIDGPTMKMAHYQVF